MTTPDSPVCECCQQPIVRRDRTEAYRADGLAAMQPAEPYRVSPETRDAIRRLFTRAPMTVGDDEVTNTRFWD